VICPAATTNEHGTIAQVSCVTRSASKRCIVCIAVTRESSYEQTSDIDNRCLGQAPQARDQYRTRYSKTYHMLLHCIMLGQGLSQNLLKLRTATTGSSMTVERLLCRAATPISRPKNRRAFSSGMTEAEREAAMKAANDKMKAYFTNRPPIEKIINSKKRSEIRDREHYIQALIGEYPISVLTDEVAT
jgi:hypothetical protein